MIAPGIDNQAAELAEACQACEGAVSARREALAQDPKARETYSLLVSKLRGLNTSDPVRMKALPKDLAKVLGPLAYDLRRHLAVLGPADGLTRLVAGHLGAFDLQPEHRLEALLACAREDAERTMPALAEAGLGPEALLPVLRLLFSQQGAFDFEEFKKAELIHLSGESDGAAATEAARRHEQTRGQRNQHLRRHQLALLPEDLREDDGVLALALSMLLERDPYGTLSCLREAGRPEPMGALPLEVRMTLLERVAARGLGLASNHLDLFGIGDDPQHHPFLKRVFQADLTAGASIFGACGLEGAPHYPFGLARIEPVLPRRIGNAEGLAHLSQGQAPDDPLPKTFRPAEIEKAVEDLQERQVTRFLEVLKADLGTRWRSHFPEGKREVVFGDPGLKIRNILYLVAHATFREAEHFDALLEGMKARFHQTTQDPTLAARLANRSYFLELLGLDPAPLFAAPPKGLGRKAFIQEIGDYQFRALLHAGMSIHLRVGDRFFSAMPIAWNMLVTQYEGPGQATQELTTLLEAIDTLLTLAAPAVADIAGWLSALVASLTRADPELPAPETTDVPHAPLRITTRATVERHRELVYGYCVQMIRLLGARTGTSTTTLIQNLRLPRNRTDKLFSLLDAERKKAKEAAGRR